MFATGLPNIAGFGYHGAPGGIAERYGCTHKGAPLSLFVRAVLGA